jgi:hypothetical protein
MESKVGNVSANLEHAGELAHVVDQDPAIWT